MNPFIPTHKITFTPSVGKPQTTEVMLLDGVAYTRTEWDAYEKADWTVENGEWECLGQTTPGGQNGTVRVERVRNQ